MINKNIWERNVYSKKKQLNIFPFPGVISFFKKKNFRNKSKINILEIGCGVGNNLIFLAQEGFNVSGKDFSDSAIKIAKKRFNQKKLKCTIKVGDIKKLEWTNNYFDYVIDRAVLTHHTNQEISLILDEIYRVLKKGGKILSFDFFGNNIPDKNFGQKFKKNTYSNFKKGNFKFVGKTSFFNLSLLKKLFYKYKILEIDRIIIKNIKNLTKFETSNVIAKK